MPTERLSMRRIRDLLRLRHENGLSTRLIATALGISKGAVGGYLQRALVAELGWPLPLDLTDTALERLLFPGEPKPASVPRPEPNWAYVDQELRRKGVTRSLLWQEYRAEHPDGFAYAWFCERYEIWKGSFGEVGFAEGDKLTASCSHPGTSMSSPPGGQAAQTFRSASRT